MQANFCFTSHVIALKNGAEGREKQLSHPDSDRRLIYWITFLFLFLQNTFPRLDQHTQRSAKVTSIVIKRYKMVLAIRLSHWKEAPHSKWKAIGPSCCAPDSECQSGARYAKVLPGRQQILFEHLTLRCSFPSTPPTHREKAAVAHSLQLYALLI